MMMMIVCSGNFLQQLVSEIIKAGKCLFSGKQLMMIIIIILMISMMRMMMMIVSSGKISQQLVSEIIKAGETPV